jgi:chromosome segregation ATPase
MKRLLVLISVLLGGVIGCVGQDDLQALRADVMALERQRASREKDTEQRVQALQNQLTRLEQSQGDVRREMAQAISAAQELRVRCNACAERCRRLDIACAGNLLQQGAIR